MRMLELEAYVPLQRREWSRACESQVLIRTLEPKRVWFSSNHTFRLDPFPERECGDDGPVVIPDDLKGERLLRLTVGVPYRDSDGYIITEKEARRVFVFGLR